MYIKDIDSNKVREYGSDPHDSLRLTNSGRYLFVENSETGYGSAYGSLRFCDSNGNVPTDIESDSGDVEIIYAVKGKVFTADEVSKMLLRLGNELDDEHVVLRNEYKGKYVSMDSIRSALKKALSSLK